MALRMALATGPPIGPRWASNERHPNEAGTQRIPTRIDSDADAYKLVDLEIACQSMSFKDYEGSHASNSP